ncbi:hypothetical protein OA88_06560 [Flavobacterium sp. JRM]|nr:hypothetical protein OA88_06560 [Flavobacterium sp. JRM]
MPAEHTKTSRQNKTISKNFEAFRLRENITILNSIINKKMKLFPTSDYTFKIIGEETNALDRLQRRTEFSENLTSKITDKSFRGIVKNNTFRIISSEIGRGAFCVLTGEIKNQNGQVHVEINKAFRIILSIFLCFPFLALISQIIFSEEKFTIIFIVVAILQVVMIRYFFIELAFRRFSKSSLNKLSDVLDIEQLEKIKA